MIPHELIDEVEKVLGQIHHRLEERRNGVAGPGTVVQLESISREFSELVNNLKHNTLPPRQERSLSSTMIVLDSWAFNEPLGEEIMRINYIYIHELDETHTS